MTWASSSGRTGTAERSPRWRAPRRRLRALGGLYIPDPRRVLAKHLRLDLGRQLRIAVAFDQLVRDLELAEGVDLPLRVAPQARIGPPHDVVRAEFAQQRPEHVRCLHWPARHCFC